jgi:hypothetical protein
MVDFTLFEHPTFLGAVLAMIGYGASAQVMVFFLPQFLQNAYGFDPSAAGLAMMPFALPMIVVPRLTTSLARRLSGRALLTGGLAVATVGNLLFWAIARTTLPYSVFIIGMLVAGTAAGVLNGQTVKVLQNAIPEDRVGMASGIASTTRFIGILVSVAALGAVMSNVAGNTFVKTATSAGLDRAAAQAAGRRVTSGDLGGILAAVPPLLQAKLHQAGHAAYGKGFAAAALLATAFAAGTCALTFLFVDAGDTAALSVSEVHEGRCMMVDCRHPL